MNFYIFSGNLCRYLPTEFPPNIPSGDHFEIFMGFLRNPSRSFVLVNQEIYLYNYRKYLRDFIGNSSKDTISIFQRSLKSSKNLSNNTAEPVFVSSTKILLFTELRVAIVFCHVRETKNFAWELSASWENWVNLNFILQFQLFCMLGGLDHRKVW